MSTENIIEKYTDISAPGSFSGLSGFLKNNKSLKNNRNVRKALKSLPAYTLHKQHNSKFERSKTLVYHIDFQWQVDLVDVSNLAGSNSNYKFILTCIDVFSKYAWAEPILLKTAANTKKAIESLMKKSGRRPKQIYCDDGKEFKGEFLNFMKSNSIRIFVAQTKNKAAVVERFNRTLKEKMYRYFSFRKNSPNKTNLHQKRYLDVLPDLLTSYNNSFHRSIQMTPTQVNKSNEELVFKNLYGYDKSKGNYKDVKAKYSVGMYVRILKNKGLFEKGYTSSWSEKIYIVDQVIYQIPLLYKLKEITKNSIDTSPGTYYAEELQHIELPFDTYKVVRENSEQLIVEKLNSNSSKQIVVPKSFENNQYSLRKRK